MSEGSRLSTAQAGATSKCTAMEVEFVFALLIVSKACMTSHHSTPPRSTTRKVVVSGFESGAGSRVSARVLVIEDGRLTSDRNKQVPRRHKSLPDDDVVVNSIRRHLLEPIVQSEEGRH